MDKEEIRKELREEIIPKTLCDNCRDSRCYFILYGLCHMRKCLKNYPELKKICDELDEVRQEHEGIVKELKDLNIG